MDRIEWRWGGGRGGGGVEVRISLGFTVHGRSGCKQLARQAGSRACKAGPAGGGRKKADTR
jgi:hypothetical protein